MSKFIFATLLIFFSFYLYHPPVYIYAFSSETEIDAYFDEQQRQLQLDTDIKNKALRDQLEIDLKEIENKKNSDKWEVYRRVYGNQFDMVKPFLPESNPNPTEHAYYISKLSREDALNAIKNIRAVNEDLADKILYIYENKQEPLNPAQNITSPNSVNKNVSLIKSEDDSIREVEDKKEQGVKVSDTVPLQENEVKKEDLPKKQSFFEKIGSVLIKLIFWK